MFFICKRLTKKGINILRQLFVFLIAALCSLTAYSQLPDNLRSKTILLVQDSTTLDTLSIIPESLQITDTLGNSLSEDHYQLVFGNAMLLAGDSLKKLLPLTLKIKYRVFPFNFSAKHFNKKIPHPFTDETRNPFLYSYSNPVSRPEYFELGSLSKNGSISRGISFGNNQDMVVNSNMNLQLAGKVGDDIDLLAAISDNNIPVQPQGNTASLQEFDKVFIRMAKGHTALTAGDFELGRPYSYFMNLNKKAQGAYFTTRMPLNASDTAVPVNVSVAAAMSKGKYARNQISGMEGNQGPYKLTGAENEQFIIILAGSEKIYIDGKLLQRGQDNDYVIDYNMAELSFTPKNQITKDKRIIAEFEYSDKKYARSMFFTGVGYTAERLSVQMNFFSEQDMKSQPLAQTLDDKQKDILRLAGDSSFLAYYPSIDSIGFSDDEIRYKMIDTLGYDSVLVYSTHPDSAHYRVAFSLLGQGKGNYVQQASAANGRVYKWIEPVNNQPQGNYEPVMVLFAPAKKQLLTLSSHLELGNNTTLSVEGAFSNNDLNTFSEKDGGNDKGYGVKASLNTQKILGRDSALTFTASLDHEFTDSDFQPIEPYRPIEFNREWNVLNTAAADENLSGLSLGLKHKRFGQAAYRLNVLKRKGSFSAWQHQLAYLLKIKPVLTDADVRITQSTTALQQASFLRHRASLTVPYKTFSAGLTTEGEQNFQTSAASDSLSGGSFSFIENGVFAGWGNSETGSFLAKANNRTDQIASAGRMKAVTAANNFSLTSNVMLGQRNRLSLEARYRELQILDTLLYSGKPDQTATGRIELSARNKSGSIVSTSFYEAGSGMEAKREFSYLELAPGQGAYTWNDFNGDGIKQLNEFQIATFQDQANYVRVYLQSSNYIKTWISQFSQTLNLNPAASWANSGGWKKVVALFSNQSSVRLERKTTSSDFDKAFNPFIISDKDAGRVYLNSALRNTVYFNRSHPIYGIEYTISDNRNTSLMNNGYESRMLTQNSLRGRLSVKRAFTFEFQGVSGVKSNESEFFKSNNYSIKRLELMPGLNWQPGNEYRISLNARFQDLVNRTSLLSSPEHAITERYTIEGRYSAVTKGSLTARFSAISIRYNAPENNSIAYEMLEALRPGQNFTWNAGIQYTFTGNLQLNLMYDGRKSPDTKAVHTGNVQLRAYF